MLHLRGDFYLQSHSREGQRFTPSPYTFSFENIQTEPGVVAGTCNQRAEARGGESEVSLGQHKTLPQNQATQNKKSTVATCVLSFLLAVLYISCRHVASPKTQAVLPYSMSRSHKQWQSDWQHSYPIPTHTIICSLILEPAKSQWKGMIQLSYKKNNTAKNCTPNETHVSHNKDVFPRCLNFDFKLMPWVYNAADSAGPLMLKACGTHCDLTGCLWEVKMLWACFVLLSI